MILCALALCAPVLAEDASVSKSYKLSQQAMAPALSLPPVVARVNGVDVSINRFWNRLVSAAGSSVLTGIVDEILLEQEAEKRWGSAKPGQKSKRQAKIDQEIEKKISELVKQFPDEAAFSDRLKDSGLTLEDLKRQMRLEVYKEKLLGDKVKVTAAEVKKYFDENKERMPKGTEWNPEAQKAIENLLRQTKMNQEYAAYIQSLRQKADIKVFLNQ